jgi:hypothetical protein
MNMTEHVAKAIEDDLTRQCALQTGCSYFRADESGVASAEMNIVVAELASAAIQATIAQGIEAAPAAETVKLGSVHESPVAKPCAQGPA